MYTNLLLPIADRAYLCAKERGKDTSALTCLTASAAEISEYLRAAEAGRVTSSDHIRKAESIWNAQKFTAFYDKHLHNTTLDELADVCLVSATWLCCAKIADTLDGVAFDPAKNFDAILANGPLTFVAEQLDAVGTAELRAVINLKLRYNELREDRICEN